MTVIINFSDSHDAHLLVQSKEDGVVVSEGFGANPVFIPDNAVLPLIRALQEFEQEQQTRLSNAWGV
jgi:hypothetical protein